MNNTQDIKFLCESCRFAKIGKDGIVRDCATIGNIDLCRLYRRCRRYQQRATPIAPTENKNINPTLF